MLRSVWCYPYAFLDETPDTVFADLAAAGLNHISIAAAYHSGRMLFPHNPRRKVVTLEGGVVYFAADEHRYCGPLRPVRSALCRDVDPLATVTDAAARRGFTVSAWLVCLHNSRLGSAHSELVLHNAFGDRYLHALCPAQPAVRSYAAALAADAARYQVTALDLEALAFMGYEHPYPHDKTGLSLSKMDAFLFSLCFCPACLAGMQQAGIEARHLKARTRRYLEQRFAGEAAAFPGSSDSDLLGELESLLGEDVHALLTWREGVVISLVHEVRHALPASVAIHLRTTLSPFFTGGKSALRPAAARQANTPLMLTFFGAAPDAIRQSAAAARASLGNCTLHAGIMACAPDTNSVVDLQERCLALQGGWAGRHYYLYDLMPQANLRWLGQAPC